MSTHLYLTHGYCRYSNIKKRFPRLYRYLVPRNNDFDRILNEKHNMTVPQKLRHRYFNLTHENSHILTIQNHQQLIKNKQEQH